MLIEPSRAALYAALLMHSVEYADFGSEININSQNSVKSGSYEMSAMSAMSENSAHNQIVR